MYKGAVMLSKKLNSTMTASAVRVQTKAATLKSRVQTAVEEKEFGFWWLVALVVLWALGTVFFWCMVAWCKGNGHGDFTGGHNNMGWWENVNCYF